jgi:hypothetical protein
METTEFHTGQKVTIFRCYPNQHFRINDKVGQIGTISNMWYYPDTDTHYAEVQLEDGSSEWFPTQMLELTPTLDQIKVGTRIQVAEHNRYIDADYAGAYGTITKPYYGVDINVDMLPDDPALRDEWGIITLSGLNRFRILEQSPERLTKTFDKVSVYIEVWSSKSDGISHKLEFKWCDGMKSSTLRDQINRFIDKMENGD